MFLLTITRARIAIKNVKDFAVFPFTSFGFLSFVNSSTPLKIKNQAWPLKGANLFDVLLKTKVTLATTIIALVFLDGFSPHYY